MRNSIVPQMKKWRGLSPTNIDVFSLRQSDKEKEDQTRASYRAKIVLEQDEKRGRDILASFRSMEKEEPEPEHPEAFCKRFGVKINYRYLREDIGPRMDRYCQKNNAYLYFRKHASIGHLLRQLDYQEEVQKRIIAYLKDQKKQKEPPSPTRHKW